MADDFLALTPIDPISMAMPGRQTLNAALDAGITARDVRNAINQTAIRVTALEGDTTAADAIANLDGRVTALEGAPAGGVNLVSTQQILHPAGADFDFIFPGAPASEPVSASFFIATVSYDVWVNVVGDVVYGAFGSVSAGPVSSGLERIPGGLRFKGGAAAWTIKSDVTSDPFTNLTLTIAASF